MSALHRRAFLTLLASGALGAAVDLDRLLWEPGKTTYFDRWTPVPLSEWFREGDIFTIAGKYRFNPDSGLYTTELQQFVVIGPVLSAVNARYA